MSRSIEEMREKIQTARAMADEEQNPAFAAIVFEAVLKELFNGASEGAKPITAIVPYSRPAETKQLSALKLPRALNEFLAPLPKSQTTLYLAIAYFSLHNNQPSLTVNDFANALASARIPRPKNPSDVVGKCIKRGWLVDALERKDGQKAWQITPTGEKYIEDILTGLQSE